MARAIILVPLLMLVVGIVAVIVAAVVLTRHYRSRANPDQRSLPGQL